MKPTRKPTRKILHTVSRKREAQEKIIGATVHFRQGDYAQAEQILADLRTLGIAHVRTPIAAHSGPQNEDPAWHDWLFPAIAQQAEWVPCMTCPAQLLPPETHYRRSLEFVATRFADHFAWIEFAITPGIPEDRYADDAWPDLCNMIGNSAAWARQQGKKTVFTAGTLAAFAHMCNRDVLRHFDAVGLCDSGNAAHGHDRWQQNIDRLRGHLDTPDAVREVWITDTGFSSEHYDDYMQLRTLLDAVDAPVNRIYWRAASPADAPHRLPTAERPCHPGLRRSDGAPTPLFRLLRDGGMNRIRAMLRLADRPVPVRSEPDVTLITGGAGFIGTNLAHRLLSAGVPVLIYDNLARPGAEQNLRWLLERHREGVEFQFADVRNRTALRQAVRRATQIFHLAAQPALTTSLHHPAEDYEVNSSGTLNLLEEIRLLDRRPPLVFTSTSKVYGTLGNIRLKKEHTRYEPEERVIRLNGIGEDQALEFRSPFACSKGMAEQYVLNYARTYGLPAMVLRAGTIYGAHQRGNQEHDWIAHFLLQTLHEEPITLYGDGLQVRDILHVDDFVDALLLAQRHMAAGAGQVFNVGGGLGNTVSLTELIDLIEIVHGSAPAVRRQDWREGDQRYYVSNLSRFTAMTGWTPQTDVGDGIRRLYRWLTETCYAAADVPPGWMAL